MKLDVIPYGHLITDYCTTFKKDQLQFLWECLILNKQCTGKISRTQQNYGHIQGWLILSVNRWFMGSFNHRQALIFSFIPNFQNSMQLYKMMLSILWHPKHRLLGKEYYLNLRQTKALSKKHIQYKVGEWGLYSSSLVNWSLYMVLDSANRRRDLSPHSPPK